MTSGRKPVRSSKVRTRRTASRAPGGWGAVVFCIAALAATLASAEPVAMASGRRDYFHVRVEGAHAMDRDAARRVLAPPIPADSIEAHLRRLSAAYAGLGFLDPALTTSVVDDSTLVVRVEEGAPARIAAVYWRGMHALPETLGREITGIQVGQRFRPADIDARLDALAQAYAERGYLDAEVVLERFELDAAGVVLGIGVTEGVPAHLVEVTVRGAEAVRPAFVQRLAGLAGRNVADVRRIRSAPQLLRRSGLFADVEAPRVYRVQGSDVGVLLHVTEAQRRNSVFGVVGVARDPIRDRPYVTGAIDLGLKNLFGSGRDLDVAWKRDELTGSRLAVGYRERFLFGGPVDFGLHVSQTELDSTSTWQTLELSGEMQLNRTLALDGGGSLDRSVFHVRTPGNTLRGRAFLGLVWTSLGREEDGGRFGRFQVRGETALRRDELTTLGVPSRSHVHQTIWGGNFECGTPIAPRHEVYARGEWHALVSDEAEIHVSELFEFGGARTLRGYREGQFRAEQVAYGGVEYRYGDPRAAQVYLFTDAGGLRTKRPNLPREASLHVGMGAGLRARVAAGTFDLSFGVGEERSLSAVKVHVALSQRF